jgi:pyruvate kinase
MYRKTKIICTLGPAVDSQEAVKRLVGAGMNIARINCSHGDWDSRRKWIKWVRVASEESGSHVGVLVDLGGPKFRLGEVAGGMLEVHPGDVLGVGIGPGQLPIEQREVLDAIRSGTVVLIGDGEISFKAKRDAADSLSLQCITGGRILSRKGLTVVGATFDVPSITQKDCADVAEATAAGCEFIALSYVKSSDDIVKLGEIVEKHDPTVQVIAKIEMKSAVADIANIIKESDGVMVARGDLGLQMPIEEVPLIQKKIIAMCNASGKPVITATQMMESMVMNPRPTRAESTDVANAILDGTDAIMLSGETASGSYPTEAVRYMSKLAEKTESSSLFARSIDASDRRRAAQATESVAKSAVEIAHDLRAKAILCFSTSGFTARMVSKFRPRVPILCCSYRVRTARQVSLLWGVRPVLTAEFYDTEEMIARGFAASIAQGVLVPGDLVVITAGIPVGRPGTTNLVTLMHVHEPKETQ